MKKISLLGSTGSIGTQALDVIRLNKESFDVEALACGRNVDLVSKQIEEFHPTLASVELEEDAQLLKRKHPKTEIFWGEEGLVEAAKCDCDLVVNGLMGIRGLRPTYEAIKTGKDIALANKETLVAGGILIMDLVEKQGVKLLPVDSEHSAIFQSLEGNQGREIKKILLTASGGPFRGYSLEQLEEVTLEAALKHPNWSMGKKITIDSATMMNKGLEAIEAKWIFGVPMDKIQILVHPQSIVHSAVEYMDNSIIAQMGFPDMKVPIGFAMNYPNRKECGSESLDFFNMAPKLTFEEVDIKTFKAVDLAFQASSLGKSYPVVLNGANEKLVELFLKRKIRFIDIQRVLETELENHRPVDISSLEDIENVDRDIRLKIESELG